MEKMPCAIENSGSDLLLLPSSSQSSSPLPSERYAMREIWLNELMYRLAAYMEEVEPGSCAKMKDWRVSCGWPFASRKAIGQCWSASASRAGKVEMFISPQLDKACEVDHVLLHEMVHASVAVRGHGGAFRKLAVKLGLEGKMTATIPSEALRLRLNEIIAGMPDYPHNALHPGDFGIKKQSTRMIKCRCSGCGYILRTTSKWLEKGIPKCGVPECEGYFELAS